MGEVSTIGIDIAKSVFQVHGVDADGMVVVRRRIGRAKVLDFFANLPPCRSMHFVPTWPNSGWWQRRGMERTRSRGSALRAERSKWRGPR